MVTTVFISGATGYIAVHTIKQLLDKGYQVVGSVRSDSKGQELSNVFNSPNFFYEIVPDIGKDGAFDEALKKHPEVTVFLHTASPVTFKVENPEEDLLKPAVQGTVNALNAIKNHAPQVKNVVVTSSFAAVGPKQGDDASTVYTEESWTDITWERASSSGELGYRGSKKFAEKAVWDFVDNNDVNFTINVINPSYVFGPQVSEAAVKENMNFSVEIVNSFLKLTPDSEIPSLVGGFIDVRDVARAHIFAFEEDSIKNQRLLLVQERWNGQKLLNILRSNFPQLQDKIPVGDLSESAGKLTLNVDNSKTRKILGFEFISLEQSVVDTVEQILAVRN